MATSPSAFRGWSTRAGGRSYDPDVIATFGVTAPTADVNPLQGILEPPNTMLGQGFWYGSWNVIFIHTVDPLIVFYGFGSRHGGERESEGLNITPGSQYNYRGGLGFAVNERVTLSACVIGSYITDPWLERAADRGAGHGADLAAVWRPSPVPAASRFGSRSSRSA